jgi:hypothetical protein
VSSDSSSPRDLAARNIWVHLFQDEESEHNDICNLSPEFSRGWGGYQCRKYHADPCGIRHIYHISYICRHIQIYIYIQYIRIWMNMCIYIYISHIHHWYIVHKPTHQKTLHRFIECIKYCSHANHTDV